MVTWVSKDTSKPYYGKEVTTSNGKVVEAPKASANTITAAQSSSGVVTYTTPQGYSTTNQAQAINETLKAQQAAPSAYNVTIGDKSMLVSPLLAEKIRGEKFYQDPKTGEIYGSLEQIPKQPEITMTSKGAVYTETGQTVASARMEQIKSSVGNFLAPAERFLVNTLGLGSEETIFKNIVQPTLAIQKQASILDQQQFRSTGKTASDIGVGLADPILRGKQAATLFGAGAFKMVTSPIETGAIITAGIVLPQALPGLVGSLGLSTGPALGAMGTGAIGLGTVSLLGIARNPQDPFLGMAEVTGEASVPVIGTLGIGAVKTALQKSLVDLQVSKTASSGFIDYSTSEEGVISKTSYSEKVFDIGGKDTYKVSTVSQSRLYPEGESFYGKGTIKLGIQKGDLIMKGTGASMESYSPLAGDIQLGKGEYEFTIPNFKGEQSLFTKAGDISFSKLLNPGAEGSSDILFVRGTKELGYAISETKPFFWKDISYGKFSEVSGGKSIELFHEVINDVGYSRFYTFEGGLKGGQAALSEFNMKGTSVSFKTPPSPYTGGTSGGVGSVGTGPTNLISSHVQAVQSSSLAASVERSIRLASIQTTHPTIVPALFPMSTPKTSVTLNKQVSMTETVPKIIQVQKTARTAVTPLDTQITKQGTTTALISPLKQKGGSSLGQILRGGQAQIIIPELKQATTQVAIQEQGLGLMTAQVTGLDVIQQQAHITSPMPFSFGMQIPVVPTVPIPGINLPSFSLLPQMYGPKNTRKVGFKKKYFPSLTAVVFNIKGPKPSDFAVSTGLGIRPMIGSTRKRSTKKRRKR
jgi:hypothetical protein